MDGETEVLELSRLPEGRTAAVFPKGLPVLLARVGADVYALENRCAHMGCPLAAGKLDGHVLTCPCHDWRFDVRDGRFLDAPEISVRTYPAGVREGRIYLRLGK